MREAVADKTNALAEPFQFRDLRAKSASENRKKMGEDSVQLQKRLTDTENELLQTQDELNEAAARTEVLTEQRLVFKPTVDGLHRMCEDRRIKG